jgi:hypothetical protein
MNRTIHFIACLAIATIGLHAFSISPIRAQEGAPRKSTLVAATAFLKSLNSDQVKLAKLDFADPRRVQWHFIPMETRKGIPLKDMNDDQVKLALELLRSLVSEKGFQRATDTMSYEGILLELEGPKSVGRRDSRKYYVAIYGEPNDQLPWGVSFEGHHMSLNFTLDKGVIVDSTPQAFASNPAVLPRDFKVPSLARLGQDQLFREGNRLIAAEEDAGFSLLNSLDDAQKSKAIFNETCPEEVLWAGEAQPKVLPYVGISAKDMNPDQKKLLQNLIETLLAAQTKDVVQDRMNGISSAGFDTIHFAWAGSLNRDGARYFRVQGPTFFAEYCNFQADAAGKKANHIHCVWRDLTGDFNLTLSK